MKIRILALLTAGAALATAQETSRMDSPINYNPVTLASQFFENNNYFNYFGVVNGVYDTYAPTYNSLGQPVNNGGFGYSIGGGLSAYHKFRKATLSVSYGGTYRDYNTPLYANGTDQNFSLAYTLRLARR